MVTNIYTCSEGRLDIFGFDHRPAAIVHADMIRPTIEVRVNRNKNLDIEKVEIMWSSMSDKTVENGAEFLATLIKAQAVAETFKASMG